MKTTQVNRTLYDIDADMMALELVLVEVGGEVTETEAEETVDRWFEENKENLAAKADSYGFVMRELETRAAARKAESERLAALAAADQKAFEIMKGRFLYFLEKWNIPKLETLHFRFTPTRNGGKLPLVTEDEKTIDWETVPAEFVITENRFNKEALRQYLAENPNNELDYALLGERGTHLRIK